MRVVALLDQSIYADSVVGYAAEIAARSGANVDLIHVVSRDEHLDHGLVGYHPGGLAIFAAETIHDIEAQMAAAHEAGKALLQKSRATLLERGAGLVRTRVVEGSMTDIVREMETEAALVILGKRGEHADFARLHLGAHVEAIVRSSTRPVLLVPRAYRPIDKCLVAFDAGGGARRVVEAIAQPGLMPNLHVRLLHVGESNDELVAAFDAASTKLANEGIPVSAGVVEDVPGKVLPEEVVRGNYSLLALGASNAPRLASLLFGSLTSDLVRATQTPVLLA